MTTLNELIEKNNDHAFVIADAGNGCALGEDGRIAEYDDAARAEYGDVVMVRLAEPHKSDDGYECLYASDWIVQGDGDNPYRVRIYF